MKRHPSLEGLSDDHHRSLVLARRLRRDSAGLDAAGLAELAREVQRQFREDLEPHFRVEEGCLLPAVESCGEARLAERTAQEHLRLRALVAGPWSESTPQELGTLLEKHVRFEERVLFPRAELLLSAAELDAVRRAASERSKR